MFGPSYRPLKVFSLALLTLVFYFVARAEFLIWNWSLFKTKPFLDILWSFIAGLRFDIAAILSVSAPLLLISFFPWPKNWNKAWIWVTGIFFLFLHIPFYVLNLVDTEFINFVGRRFSYDALFIANEVPGKFWNFVVSYWLLFFINTLLVFAFILAVVAVIRQRPGNLYWPDQISARQKVKAWVTHGFLCFVCIVIAVIGIRGGLQKKPVNFVNANVFAAPLLNNLILNSTFTLIKSYGAQKLKQEKYFSDKEEMLSLLNGSMQPSMIEGKRPTQRQNVVIIMLESFGEEYLGSHNGKTYTPFLDSLSEKSLVFRNGYANGRRSIEGVGAIMGGIPALMAEPFISSHFTSNYFLGLGTLLGQQGYSTSFFHGGHNGTMYFDSFMKSAGVEKYYGATEYNNPADDDGVWGIWDEPFLQWMITQLDNHPQPFLTSVFTLTSHQPYKVPAQYKDRFPEGPIEILKAIAYTDHSLQRFFESAQKKSWYPNTLFIIMADHTSIHYRKEYENDRGSYRIPFILFHPTVTLPKVDPTMVVQQIDVPATVLDFLNISPKEKNYLGSSMFVQGDKVAVNFIDGRYLLFARDAYVRWTPGHEEPQMFAITDLESERELQGDRKDLLVRKLKAHIQYFNEGMWDNKLYYPAR